MAAIAIVALVLLLVGVPAIVINRDMLFRRRTSYGERRGEPPLPFLVIPTSGATDIVPSTRWAAETEEPRWRDLHKGLHQPVMREPGIADLPTDWSRPSEPRPDETIIFQRPADEPLQILPGKLKVLAGEDRFSDIRLVGKIGEPARLIVGRDTGAPHEQVTLRSPTVSRKHAQLEFVDGHWSITNLSATNPVMVNEQVLANGNGRRVLHDGDQIDLGEVRLRFDAT